MSFSAMMFVMLLMGGGENTGDLLDFNQTQMYWEMRDQRIVDLETMAVVLNDDDATASDTLMAIRAIGEWVLIREADPEVQADPADKAKALKLIAPYVGSKDLFVDRYAKRYTAWLKGEEAEGYDPLPAKVYDMDLALLPDDATLVGQMKIANGVGPVDLAGMIPDIKIEGQSMRDAMMAEILPGITQASMMIGNARADLITLGAVLNDEEDVSFMLVVRGQYDRVGVQMALEDTMGEEDDASFFSVGDIEVITVDNHDPFALMMPSDELFILLFAERRGTKLPVDAVAKKLTQADLKPTFDEALSKQVAAIERDKADIWAAIKITPMMKQEPDVAEVFGAFDAGRAFAVRDAEGMLDVKWTADGTVEADVAKAVAYCTDGIKKAIEETVREKQRIPAPMQVMMEPVLKMLESMTFKQDGKTMTGGMKVDPGIGMTMPMMMFGMNVRHHDHAVGEAELAAEDAADAVEEAVAE